MSPMAGQDSMEDHSGGICGLRVEALCVISSHIPSLRTWLPNHLYQQKRPGNVIQLCVQEAGEIDIAEYPAVSAIGYFQFIAIINNSEMHTTSFQSLFTFSCLPLEHIIYRGNFESKTYFKTCFSIFI